VTLFPEGSTSPGDGLMEFKKTLLESAVRSRCRVLPVAIKYLAVDGARYDESTRDTVAWYGDMTFFPHLVRLAATKSIEVDRRADDRHGCGAFPDPRLAQAAGRRRQDQDR
jgi:lyso-ornithine lipid O-acyltransferase